MLKQRDLDVYHIELTYQVRFNKALFDLMRFDKSI